MNTFARIMGRRNAKDVKALEAAIANLDGGGGGGVNEEAVTLIAQGVMAPLVNPVTASLTLTAPTGAVEVGLPTTPAMNWAISNVANAASAKIVDGSNDALIQNLTLAASGTYTAPSAITKTQVASQSYKLVVTDKAGRNISSTVRTVNWYFGVYYGTSSNTTLNEAGIKALTKRLQASMSGTYVFDDGNTNYKYIIIPATFPTIDMVNDASGLAFPLQQIGGNVNVTVNGITTAYKILRSELQVGNATVRNK